MKKNKICIKLIKLKGKKFTSSSKKEYIGLIKINLDNGQSEYLKIFSNSNSDELAYDFCLKHKIDFSLVKKMITKIKYIKDNKISTASKEKAEISFNIGNSILKNKENKENIEINGLNNFFYNENNLTPINCINNEQINNLYDTEEKSITNILDNGKMINVKLDYKNTEKKDFFENNNNNNDINYELNDSLNDKLNNLEKAYNNFNPANKVKNSMKEGKTKEVIDSTIQECMDIIEKEESNNFNISSPDYSKNYIKVDKENKSAPILDNNYLYSTPKIRQNEPFGGSNLNKSKMNKINNSSENKENISNNYSKNKNNNLALNTKLNDNMFLVLNKNYEIKNNNNSYFNTINHNETNSNKINKFNQINIEHNIEFSLITKKRNYLFLCSNKDTNSIKPNIRKTIPISKNSRKIRLINKKFYNLQKNINSSFKSQNKKNILYNDNKSSIKTITNYSTLKTVSNSENDNPVFSTIKTFSNCDLLSSNISDNSTHCKNRVTLINNTNYSNLVSQGSTNAKLFKKLDSFNSNKSSQINKIRNSNHSNNLLYIPQYQNKKNKYSYNNHKRTLNPENTINLKNINRKIKKGKKKKLILVNNSFITDNSFNKIKEKNTKSIFVPKTTINKTDYLPNKSKFLSRFKNHNANYTICRNKITSNLIEKNEIINSFKNIFNKITKNNKILDAFSLVNRNNIPSPIYDIVKTILKNCNNKNRFVEYNDFINMAFILFDKFSNEEKISILNYKGYF